MLLQSLLLVFQSILVAKSSLGVSTPSTWSIEYHLSSTSSTTANPLSVPGQQPHQARIIWPNYSDQQSHQQPFPWNGIRRQQKYLPAAEFHPFDFPAIINNQPAKRPLQDDESNANRSMAATQLSLIDLLARLSASVPVRTSTHNNLARSDAKNRPKRTKSTTMTKYGQSRHLSDLPESTSGVHFDEPLEQNTFEERELDPSGNANGRDFVALWHDLPQANLISESRILKPAFTEPSMMDNLIAASKYPSISAAATHQMPAIYSFPMPIDHHKMLPRKGGIEKSLILSILVGIGAGILSFLFISNLFLSIPLLALTLMQFLSGQNLMMPNNNNNNNMMPMPSNGQNQNTPTTSQVGKRRKRDLLGAPLELVAIQDALDKASLRYQ